MTIQFEGIFISLLHERCQEPLSLAGKGSSKDPGVLGSKAPAPRLLEQSGQYRPVTQTLGCGACAGPLGTMLLSSEILTSSLEGQHPWRCDAALPPLPLPAPLRGPLSLTDLSLLTELRWWASGHREAKAVRTRGSVSSRVANCPMSQS